MIGCSYVSTSSFKHIAYHSDFIHADLHCFVSASTFSLGISAGSTGINLETNVGPKKQYNAHALTF